jgi:ribosome-associated toxin RatA of RatAB toxin-antitoxin module
VSRTLDHRVRRITREALPLLLVLLVAGADAATIAISVASHADTIEIECSALLNADATAAWNVLTAYERYVDFIPGLQRSRVVARKGTTVTVEQSGHVTLWLLQIPLNVTLEIVEFAPTRLESRAVSGDLRALASRYVLTPVGNAVRLEYAGQLDTGFALISAIERMAVKQNVARRFQALADEIERRGAASRSQIADPANGPANVTPASTAQ